jgi:nucleoside permease NupC
LGLKVFTENFVEIIYLKIIQLIKTLNILCLVLFFSSYVSGNYYFLVLDLVCRFFFKGNTFGLGSHNSKLMGLELEQKLIEDEFLFFQILSKKVTGK